MKRLLALLVLFTSVCGAATAQTYGDRVRDILSSGASSSGSGSASPPPPVETSVPPEQRPVLETVAFYVQAKSREGLFPVEDPQAGKRSWMLKLESLSAHKLDPGHFLARGGFVGTLEGEETAFPVELDIYLAGQGSRWRVTDVWIRSVNGTARPQEYSCPNHPFVTAAEGCLCPLDRIRLRKP